MSGATESIKKRSILSKPAKASACYLAVSGAAKAVGFLVTPIFTRLLPGVGYGEYTLYMSWLGLLSLTLTSLLSSTVIYKGLVEYKDKKQEYVSSVLGVSLLFSAGICTLLFTFMPFLGIDSDLVLILSLQILCDIILSISFIYSRYSYDYLRVGLLTLAQAVISPLVGILLISSTEVGFRGRIYGLLFASVLIAVPILSKILNTSPKIYDKAMWRHILSHTAPLFPHAISVSLSLQIDRFIISSVMGEASLAKYSVAHSLGAGLTIAVSAAGAALNPWIVRKLSRGEGELVGRIVIRAVGALSAAIMLLVSLTPFGMRLLAPPEYAESVSAVFPIALATIPTFLSSVASVGLVSRERGGTVSVCATVSSLVSIALGFLLIPVLGYFGAGLSHLLTQSILAFLSLYALRRYGIKETIPVKSTALAFVLCMIFGITVTLSGVHLFLRFGLLLCAFALLVYQGFKLFSAVREK